MSSAARRSLASLIVAAAVVWHALTALAPPAPPLGKATAGQAFAVAAQATDAARGGADPYAAPAGRARGQRYARAPAALVWTSWAPALQPTTARWLWWALGELSLLGAGAALWWWWRPAGDAVAPSLAAAVALSFGVGHAQLVGHDATVSLGLLAVAASTVDRAPLVAGAALGAAWPLSTAPWVLAAVWAAQRRPHALAAAAGTGVTLAATSIGMFGVSPWASWAASLPALASGAWFGPRAIGGFDNHSLVAQLSPAAGAIGPVILAGLTAALAYRFRHRAPDPLAGGAQLGAVALTSCLGAAYVPDAQLALAVPALALTALAASTGRLGLPGSVAAGLAWAALAVATPHQEQLVNRLLTPDGLAARGVQALPLLALVALLLACIVLARPVRGGPAR